MSIDANYFNVVDAVFIEGHNLSTVAEDSTGVIVNEAARNMPGGQSAVWRELILEGMRRTL